MINLTKLSQRITPAGTRSIAQIFKTADEAIAQISNGDTVGIGGFGICGVPENLCNALEKSGKKNLTLVSTNAGIPTMGVGQFLKGNQMKRFVGSYAGENPLFEEQYLSG